MKNHDLTISYDAGVPCLSRLGGMFGKSMLFAVISMSMSLTGLQLARADLVFELLPQNFDSNSQRWAISQGSLFPEYFQAAGTPKYTRSAAGTGYSAMKQNLGGGDANTGYGGPLVPASLVGANPRTLEAWTYDPTCDGVEGIIELAHVNDGNPPIMYDGGNFSLSNGTSQAICGYRADTTTGTSSMSWAASTSARSGKWVHLVVTFDGTTAKSYLNGVLDSSKTYAYNTQGGNPITVGSLRTWDVGAHSTGELYHGNYSGYIGLVRAYDNALSDAEVAARYALGVNGGEAQAANYTISGTVTNQANSAVIAGAQVYISTTSPATASGQTAVLTTGADGTYTATVAGGSTYYVTAMKSRFDAPAEVTLTGLSANQTVNFPLTANNALTALVSFDASGLPEGELLAWANAGTVGGSANKVGAYPAPTVTVVGGKKAVTFDNNATLRATFAAPAGITGNSDWSVAYWVYNPVFQGDEYPLGWARNSGGRAANFGIGNYWRAIDHNGISTSFGTKPLAATWQHVAVTYDGNTEKLYLNGVLNQTATGRVLDIYPGDYPTMGTGVEGDGGYIGWARFSGSIKSLSIYDQALTAEEVAVLGGPTTYTITASAGSNGAIDPSGAVSVLEGASKGFTITPVVGYRILDVLVDGVTNAGAIATGSYTFDNVSATHTIQATFEERPWQTVSGKVTSGGTGVQGATVYFKLSPNASVSPAFTTTTVDADGNFSLSLPTGDWYVCVGEIHYFTSPDVTMTVASSPVTLSNIVIAANPNWDLLFALNTDDLSGIADGARIYSWGGMSAYQTYNNEQPLLGPVVETIGGINWEKNTRASYNAAVSPVIHDRGDGFLQGTYASDIAVNGATIVAVVKPAYKAVSGEVRGEIVDIFYGDLFLAVNHIDGEVIVCTRGYAQHPTGYHIPDGQKTILSLVVQPSGGVTLYANGELKWSYASGADYTSLRRVDGHDKIAVGRNAYDGWSAFNGNMGDIYVYKSALDDTRREALQTSLATKFNIVPPVYYTINAFALTGGTISPSGDQSVLQGTDQTFIITPVVGYRILDVKVDSETNATAIATGSYTFANVTAPHTISVMFEEMPPQTVSGKVTNGTTGIQGATVYFKASANASVSPIFTTTTIDADGNFSISLPTGNWYVCAGEVRYFTSMDATFTVASAPVGLSNIVLTANPDWELLFSLNTDEFSGLADGARITTWGGMTARETYNNGLPMLGPVVESLGGVKWEQNSRVLYDGSASPVIHIRQDGFQSSVSYVAPLAANGVSVVMAVKPVRKAIPGDWTALVSIFHTNMVLGIRNDDGRVMVMRKGTRFYGPAIADGQKTILSMVMQPTGAFKVYANSIEVVNETSTSDMSALTPGSNAFEKYIYVGRGADDWAVFNGNIGDVYTYRTALDDVRRETLQSNLASKFGVSIPVYRTIRASAGANGTISPSGDVSVLQGTSPEFIITPADGYGVDVVTVDGLPVSGHPTSYRFDNISGDRVISVTFAAVITDPFVSWIHMKYPGLTSPYDTADADPDGDGRSNKEEFAFGLDPTNATSSNPVSATLSKSSHKFSYTRRPASGLNYTVWVSTDMKDWGTVPAEVTESIVSDVDGVQTVEVTLTSPPGGGRVFVRVAAN